MTHTKPMGIQQKYFQGQILNELMFTSLGIVVVKFCRFWQFNLFYMHFLQKWFKYQHVYFFCKENSNCHNMGQTDIVWKLQFGEGSQIYGCCAVLKSCCICHFTQSHPHLVYPGCISQTSGAPNRAPIRPKTPSKFPYRLQKVVQIILQRP